MNNEAIKLAIDQLNKSERGRAVLQELKQFFKGPAQRLDSFNRDAVNILVAAFLCGDLSHEQLDLDISKAVPPKSMRLTLEHTTVEGKKVVCWNIWRQGKHVAGGMCENDEHARNDANIWARDNLRAGDRMKLDGNNTVQVHGTLDDTRHTCFVGNVIVRLIMQDGKVGKIQHVADPSRLSLL